MADVQLVAHGCRELDRSRMALCEGQHAATKERCGVAEYGLGYMLLIRYLCLIRSQVDTCNQRNSVVHFRATWNAPSLIDTTAHHTSYTTLSTP